MNSFELDRLGDLDAISLITASLILMSGVVTDIRSRRFPNWLFIACSLLAFAVALFARGWVGVAFGTIGFFAGIACYMPLVLMGVTGAGDMKLLAAFGIAAGWNAVGFTAILSLIWGAVFGVVRVVVNGDGRAFLLNLYSLLLFRSGKGLELHKMPFTIAIFMGWLTYIILQRVAL